MFIAEQEGKEISTGILYHLRTTLTTVALQPFSQKFTTFTGSVYYQLQVQYLWPQ